MVHPGGQERGTNRSGASKSSTCTSPKSAARAKVTLSNQTSPAKVDLLKLASPLKVTSLNSVTPVKVALNQALPVKVA